MCTRLEETIRPDYLALKGHLKLRLADKSKFRLSALEKVQNPLASFCQT